MIVNAMMNRIKFPLPRNASFHPRPSLATRSSSIAASISAISCRTSFESIGSLRKYARFLMASWLRPTEASHRGDSATVKSPMSMMPAGTSWKPKGNCQTNGESAAWRPTPSSDRSGKPSRKLKQQTRRRKRTVDKVRNHNTNCNHDLE